MQYYVGKLYSQNEFADLDFAIIKLDEEKIKSLLYNFKLVKSIHLIKPELLDVSFMDASVLFFPFLEDFEDVDSWEKISQLQVLHIMKKLEPHHSCCAHFSTSLVYWSEHLQGYNYKTVPIGKDDLAAILSSM